MTKDEALRLALDALKATMTTHGTKEAIYEAELAAIQACEKALAQPEREWVGLTDEEIYLCTNHIDRNSRGWANEYARSIEAKLKEKNT